MAEFCLECWNKMNGTNHNEKEYVLSKDLDLCKNCGEWKHIIVTKRKKHHFFECMKLKK